jgi:hypothetical protein
MPLDFETLRKETIDPGDNLGASLGQRRATLGRLGELGITDQVVAQTCAVEPRTVRAWRSRYRNPGHDTARRALDRLGPLIMHMEDDLGLTDEAIADFLTEEPDRTKGSEKSDGPAWGTLYKTPLMTRISAHIGSMDGLETIQARLEARFPERQVYAQAGVVATPETVV